MEEEEQQGLHACAAVPPRAVQSILSLAPTPSLGFRAPQLPGAQGWRLMGADTPEKEVEADYRRTWEEALVYLATAQGTQPGCPTVHGSGPPPKPPNAPGCHMHQEGGLCKRRRCSTTCGTCMAQVSSVVQHIQEPHRCMLSRRWQGQQPVCQGGKYSCWGVLDGAAVLGGGGGAWIEPGPI